jgi:sulfur carrier protein
MRIWLNGEAVELEEGGTLSDLCKRFGIKPAGTAISLNGELVPRDEYGKLVLEEASRVEVMVLVGGG